MSPRRVRTHRPSPSAPRLTTPEVDDAVTDAMGMAGGLLMSVFGRSKKNGRGKLDTALVDIQVLGIADKARKALDAGLAVELLVEKVVGEGCLCPHCACDVKDVPDDPPLEPKSLVDLVKRNLQPYEAASHEARDAFLKKLERREAWRALHCPPECGGNWSQCCPGCHDKIPDDFDGGSK